MEKKGRKWKKTIVNRKGRKKGRKTERNLENRKISQEEN